MIEVLLVDDEESFLELAETYLERENKNFDIETSSSPSQALELIEDNNYDCVVCDYQMPELNGIELLEKLRKELDTKIPFIMFPGKGREEVAMEALNLGANRYIRKGGGPKSQFGVLAEAIVDEYRHWISEKELRESEREKSLILNNASELVAYHDTGHNLKRANKAYAEATGQSVEEMKGRKCYDIWLGRDDPCLDCPVNRAIESGETEEEEMFPPGEPKEWVD